MKKEKPAQNLSKIADGVKKLRKNNGLNQIEFAKRAGVGLRFVRELEPGKTTVRMDKLMQVLEFLGYHLELERNESKIFGANETIA
jgi:y4mF family transcriptional regulator